ncbi:MAG: DUF1036 domain-containing protein [Xanthobacteraceae bacterium]|nr:DUF1036 domain-containing protein [Xanthobacteraceae bacterium]
MRAWKPALAVAVCALGLALLPAAHAQFKPTPAPGGGGPAAPGGAPAPPAQGDQFTFKVCNKASIPLFVAMLYKVDGGAWRTVGWVSFKPGVCGPASKGTFPRNDFYWYAEDQPGNVSYSGKDAYGCINSNDGFDRTVSGDYQCAPNEKIVGFTKIDDRSAREGITLTD